jgi:restriction system protein
MARRRKKDPDIVDVFGIVVVLGVFILIADSKFRNALHAISGVVIALAVFVCVFIVLVLVFRFFKPSSELAQDARIPETPSLDVVSTTPLAPFIEQDDSRYMPKPIDLAQDDARYQPRPTKSLQEQLHSIDWFQFEKLMELAYADTGTVTRKGGANPDGGIDLIVERQGKRIGVQCKHWKTWKVGVKVVREMIGAMADAGLKKGIVVSLNPSSQDAVDLAARHNIELVNEQGVIELLKYLDQADVQALLNDTRKICPKCEREMVLRTAGRGKNEGSRFWGCSGYPRCRFNLKAFQTGALQN